MRSMLEVGLERRFGDLSLRFRSARGKIMSTARKLPPLTKIFPAVDLDTK